VVCDFNGDNPSVFTGSSNLASGGEKQNGDNLLAIHDSEFATASAVEAIRLVDHYHISDEMELATKDNPLTLQAQNPKGEDLWGLRFATKVAQELVDELETGNAPIERGLMMAKRLARLLRDTDAEKWLDYESHRYSNRFDSSILGDCAKYVIRFFPDGTCY